MAEIRRSPVEVGSLSHYFQGLQNIPGGWAMAQARWKYWKRCIPTIGKSIVNGQAHFNSQRALTNDGSPLADFKDGQSAWVEFVFKRGVSKGHDPILEQS